MHSLVECVVALDFLLVQRARTMIDHLRSRIVLSSSYSRHSRVSRRYARDKEIWMARNTADLRDEIMITRTIPPQARNTLLWLLGVHRFSNLSDFFCEFSVTVPPTAGNGESTVVHLPHQKFVSASSSLPFHVIVLLLYLSNERPYTYPGWPVHSRRRFYMQEVFFF